MTVYDDLKAFKGYKKHTGTYGIEIETEAPNPYAIPLFKYWKYTDEEHSLRGFGIEYMLKAPLMWPEEIDVGLREFETKTAHCNFDKDSGSTSIHVHMNMLDESWLTLANIFTTYSLFENLLIRFSGPSRRSNLFCMPICDAEEQYKDIIQLLRYIKLGHFQRLWNFEEKTNKYSALNFVPLTIHGSIEFRSFRGDPSSAAIKTWIDILNHILLFSRQAESPAAIIDLYRQDKNRLGHTVFGNDLLTELYAEAIKQGDDPEKLIAKNFWYAASIALWNKDWTSFGVIEKAPLKVDKAFDKFCMETFGKPHNLLTEEEKNIVEIIYKNNGGNLKDPLALNQGLGQPWAQAALQEQPKAFKVNFEADLELPYFDGDE
mgnify:CR=1 FL=1